MRRFAIVVAGALVLGGCGSVRYPTSYLLNLPAPPRSAPSRAMLGSLEVREFRCPEYLCEGRIVYRPSPEEVGFYDHHRWALNPRQAITQSVAAALRAHSLFRNVAVQQRGMGAAYVLTGSIERLEEVDAGRTVQAVCTISAQIMDAQTGSVLWNDAASETVSVEPRNVAGVVSSLSSAARTAVDRLVASAANELASGQTQ